MKKFSRCVDYSLLFALFLCSMSLFAQNDSTLAARLSAIMSRPEYKHSRFGIEFYSLDTKQVIYAHNENELFIPGSTTKLLTMGTALKTLGPDYRFKTRVYRTGTVAKNGTLKGNIVLVASGDPDISGRIQSDGTLAFENEDHSYAGIPGVKPVPGDPLMVIKELAKQIADTGIKKVEGQVLVDVSLFPEGARELVTGVVISPIVVNDNLIDIEVTPGKKIGDAASLATAPMTRYATFINTTKTVDAAGKFDVNLDNKKNPDGTWRVTVTGTVPLGKEETLCIFIVPEPSKFAETVLTEALESDGIRIVPPKSTIVADFNAFKKFYTPENQLAVHISPPFSQEVKVTLKVSQNLHASMMPYLLGALSGKPSDDLQQTGFDIEHQMLQRAGLDLSAASQSDGAGGDALFAPDFIVHYLAFMAAQPFFPTFRSALPVLGRDGTLADVLKTSPAAGHIFAKTGTFTIYNALNRNMIVTGKGLAGYIDTANGDHLIFAAYANFIPVSMESANNGLTEIDDLLGEIAASAYDAPKN